MNCSIARRNLLAADNPRSPADAEASHLGGCASCRAWHRRLVRLERTLPLIAVPASPVPASLLEQLRRPRRLIRPSSHDRRRTVEAGRQKLALAFSLAASLAVFTLAWWAWPQLPPASLVPHRSVDSYAVRRDKKLAPCTTAPRRATVLAEWAEEYLDEVRKKGHDPARLAALAIDIDRLLLGDLIEQVRSVEPGQRKAVASSIALHVSHLESEASRLAAAWAPHHARSASAVRRIASSAREAHTKLRLLA